MSKIAVVMGSQSDLTTLEGMIRLLKKFELDFEAKVLSAHRTPDEAAAYAKGARENGIDVIIAAAGKAAHLPGVLSAHTTLPVIGIPVKASVLDGMDALFSIVQMPTGIPVATVGINGAENAALLAIEMLAIRDEKLAGKLAEHRASMKKAMVTAQESVDRRISEL